MFEYKIQIKNITDGEKKIYQVRAASFANAVSEAQKIKSSIGFEWKIVAVSETKNHGMSEVQSVDLFENRF